MMTNGFLKNQDDDPFPFVEEGEDQTLGIRGPSLNEMETALQN